MSWRLTAVKGTLSVAGDALTSIDDRDRPFKLLTPDEQRVTPTDMLDRPCVSRRRKSTDAYRFTAGRNSAPRSPVLDWSFVSHIENCNSRRLVPCRLRALHSTSMDRPLVSRSERPAGM